MSDHYILEGREIKKVDLMTWAKWFEENRDKKRVVQDDIGDLWVSTTFLGLDHSWGDGPPLLFETMVFRHNSDGTINFNELYQDRCSTYAEAEAMHAKACAHARANLLN